MSTHTEQNDPAETDRRPKGGFLRRFHVWIGLAASLPWILQGLTGALLVFEPELDGALNPDLFYVEPEGERLSLDAQFEVVRQERPDLAEAVYGLDISGRADHSTQMLAKPEGEVGPKDGVRLFVDPYRGELLGVQGYRDSLMGK
ncbi:MAG: PepSY-associated TM helix domain-containing protein, partial [Verrucomicrobiota bacterium]